MMQIETQFGQLHLNGMDHSLKALLKTRRQSEQSMEGGLDILLQVELQDRETRRFDRLQKSTRFCYLASIEEIRSDASRGIDKAHIARLATGTTLIKVNRWS